jgi:hypothetical protein
LRLRVVALLLVVLSSACVAHPVGPARTFGKYESKARTTAESALSEVQTAKLVAEAAASGNAFGPFTGLVLGDAEEALAGLDGTFGSIQPPDERADRLRDDLGAILADAEDHVAELRIAARRGQLRDLGDLAASLDGDIELLQHLLEEHAS